MLDQKKIDREMHFPHMKDIVYPKTS